MVKRRCKICGKEYFTYLSKNNQKITCSKKCHSELMRKKMVGNKIMLGKKLSIKTRKKLSEALKGANSPLWKGGISSLERLIRNSFRYRLWYSDIFKRDNFTCQKYKIRGGDLSAHHIKNFAQILKENNIKTFQEAMNCEELWDIDNGITFSKKAHEEFHKKYKKKNNTIEQVNIFIS